MEILVVVAIIVILAGSAGFVAMNHFENAKKDLAKTNVLALDQEIGIWRTRHGDYPPDLSTLAQLGPNGEAATLTLRRPPRRLSVCNADSSLLKPSDNSRSAFEVTGVSASLPLFRSNRGVSRNSSSERI